MDSRLVNTLERLRAAKFADLRGTHVTATIPIATPLLNELIAAALPRNAPVRDVSVQPQTGNRITVRARLGKAEFLPPFTINLAIERQPQLPAEPLVLRLLSLPGLMALAGSAFSSSASLPPGIRLDGDRVLVDVRVLLARAGFEDLLPLIQTIIVTTDEGRLILAAEVKV